MRSLKEMLKREPSAKVKIGEHLAETAKKFGENSRTLDTERAKMPALEFTDQPN